MANKNYQTPAVEIIRYEATHTLMVSEPTPAQNGGPGLAPERKLF